MGEMLRNARIIFIGGGGVVVVVSQITQLHCEDKQPEPDRNCLRTSGLFPARSESVFPHPCIHNIVYLEDPGCCYKKAASSQMVEYSAKATQSVDYCITTSSCPWMIPIS